MCSALRWSMSWLCLALCQCTSQSSAARSGSAAQPAATVAPSHAAASVDSGAAWSAPAADSGTVGGQATQAMRTDAGESADADGSKPATAPAADSGTTAGQTAQAMCADAGNTADSSCGKPAADSGMTAGQAASADAGNSTAADSGEPTPEDTSCLNAITQLDGPGPFAHEDSSDQALKLWIPKLPAGCKAPVVHFANGTGASCSSYRALMERFASHGFLTVCAETPTTGTGVPGLDALAAVLDRHPELAAHKLGSAGHESGGQGAILTLQQAEAHWGARATYAGMAIAPTSGHGSQPPSGSWQDAYAQVRSPLLVMSIAGDALVPESWIEDGVEALSAGLEVYWYAALETTHVPIPIEHMQQLAIAWFRWKLLGDNAACSYFRQLPEGERWDERAARQAQRCSRAL